VAELARFCMTCVCLPSESRANSRHFIHGERFVKMQSHISELHKQRQRGLRWVLLASSCLLTNGQSKGGTPYLSWKSTYYFKKPTHRSSPYHRMAFTTSYWQFMTFLGWTQSGAISVWYRRVHTRPLLHPSYHFNFMPLIILFVACVPHNISCLDFIFYIQRKWKCIDRLVVVVNYR